MEDYDDLRELKDSEPLMQDIISDDRKNNKRIKSYLFFGGIFLLVIVLLIIIILIISSSSKKEGGGEDESKITILKKDSEFLKPNNILNMKFELIQLENGLKVFLINDNYTSYSSFYVETPHGYAIDTLYGLAHLSEHLSFAGNSNIKEAYKMWDIVYSLGNSVLYAFTHANKIHYFFSVPEDINFEESLTTMQNYFMNPYYNTEIIKEEIQSVSSESTQKNNYFEIIGNQIITDLANEKTSFHGYGMGNNQTMNISQAETIKKFLIGNAIRAYDPKNLIYVIYSNKSIEQMEQLSAKILGKAQRKFDKSEYDEDDVKQREKNNKDINSADIDIFGDKLYLHTIVLNPTNNDNTVNIYINIKKFDFKAYNFELSDYLNYLMMSDSLFEILKSKKYIFNEKFLETKTDIFFENNVLLKLTLKITDDAYNNHLDDVLLIIYKYFKLIKENASKEMYFNNFKQKMEIISNNTQKEYFQKGKNQEIFTTLIEKYKYLGFEQFLKFGTPKEYNEENLKYFAERFSVENTFVLIGTNNNLTESKIFETFEKKKVYGFERTYNYSKLTNDFIDTINNDEPYENLTFREISTDYFTQKTEKVIPCFKEEKNTCKEKNEFDINEEDKYNGTILDESDKKFITIYQKDKSSETHLVNIYLNLAIQPRKELPPLIDIIVELIKSIYEMKLKNINEIKNTVQIINNNKNVSSFKIQTYSDVSENIFKKLIDVLNQNITQEELTLAKDNYINSINSQLYLSYSNIFMFKLYQFYNKGKDVTPTFPSWIIDQINLDSVTLTQEYSRNISQSKLLVAGNINEELVQKLHDYIKSVYDKNNDTNDTDNNFINTKEIKIKNNLNSHNSLTYVYNYYEKFEYKNEIDGIIMIGYLYNSTNLKLSSYLPYFINCGKGIFLHELKDKYMDAYGPFIGIITQNQYLKSNHVLIVLQGRMTEPDDIDEHVQIVLKNILEGKIKCPEFESIKKSLLFKEPQSTEKTPNNLFNKFINTNSQKNINEVNDILEDNDEYIPSSFEDVINEVKDIFINPKRITAYGYRSDIDEDEMNQRIENKKNNTHYYLNEDITPEFTNNISYLIDKDL